MSNTHAFSPWMQMNKSTPGLGSIYHIHPACGCARLRGQSHQGTYNAELATPGCGHLDMAGVDASAIRKGPDGDLPIIRAMAGHQGRGVETMPWQGAATPSWMR